MLAILISTSKILGIGDQGVGGILISVAKLVLYTLCAGINPARTLPVVLDCGTNVRILCNKLSGYLYFLERKTSRRRSISRVEKDKDARP